MSRLTALKPRMKPAEGRQFAEALSTEAASGWGSGRGGRPWRRKREAILLRDLYMCQCDECKGGILPANEVDHIVPLSQGGSNDDNNLRGINCDCHKKKTHRESKGETSRK